MSKIEVLFGEYANLYGDRGNIKYIEEITDNAQIINTGLKDMPKFLTEDIDFVYLGPTTEIEQERIIEILKPYKEKIEEKIEQGLNFLVVGNSIELFGYYIEKTDGTKIEGLGIFDVYSKRLERFRHNDLVMGKTVDGDYTIVGFKNQMSHLYGADKNYFLKLDFGSGRDGKEIYEGIKYKNFIGTYVIGPILPLNPEFASYIINKMGLVEKDNEIKKAAIDAYNYRVKEYEMFKNHKK